MSETPSTAPSAAEPTDAPLRPQDVAMSERELLDGFFASLDDAAQAAEVWEVVRKGRVFYRFSITPLHQTEYEDAEDKSARKEKSRAGLNVRVDTNATRYNSLLIYKATVPEDRARLWDNKTVWAAMREKYKLQIATGVDVVERALFAGEKAKLVERIDTISGFGASAEDTAKN